VGTRPNPTRLSDAILKEQQESVDRLTDDPEFAPALLPSEAAAVQDYADETAPLRRYRPGHIERRLRPVGLTVIWIWVGSLAAAAAIRHFRQK